jgi:hypothetical protein
MTENGLGIYLNDHLAGATFGSDLARQIHEHNEGTPLGRLMGSLATEIEEDRQTLIELMELLGTSKNPVKQATTWMAEKMSRPKFSGLAADDPGPGTFLGLETLALGVAGKMSLWIALKTVADDYPALETAQLDRLIERAAAQRGVLERERVGAGRQALKRDDASS